MPSAKRRVDPGVAQRLLRTPHGFQFFQALRVLERLFAREKGDAPLEAHVRFRNTLSLSFPASEIEALEAYADDGTRLEREAAIDHAVMMEELGAIHITPAFMGLLGATGVLPLHYTEMLAQREKYERDRTPRAFLDIFSNRAVMLHYHAWKKYRLEIQHELHPERRFLPLMLSLSGLGMHGLNRRMVDGDGDVFDEAVAHFAAATRQRPVSATFLQRILCDYFAADIRVEQFVGAWYAVPQEARTRIGMRSATLGVDALSGDRIWQRDLRMRLWIGPLDKRGFNAFLPGGTAAQGLSKWLTLLTGACLEYEVRLILKAEDVAAVGLHKTGGARLGLDSYLISTPAADDRSDTIYTIHTLT
jgi:type VI secretion system protein ImpH